MEELLQKINHSRPAAIFLDYDGTLARIRKKPELARLPSAKKIMLKNLAKNLFTAVISGRSLTGIQSLVGLPELNYAGNHGLEIRCRGIFWRHPQCIHLQALLDEVVNKIKAHLHSFPGVLIENKGCTASIHFRMTPPDLRYKIEPILKEEISPFTKTLTIRRGKMVYEILPALNWNKGNAIQKIMEMAALKRHYPLIYIGDDRTDEDAFAVLSDRDISIHVGENADTKARYRLKNTSQVWNLIRSLVSESGTKTRS